ncbi:hypothetical protein N7509_008342 [Penicillium cosmopolitanum]|uniref:carbonic anhydrase n=1 Tax=Penicillium cosmopolitanum TaxID=1131564 RepID=A0A9W9VME1_9EURO|nr:uncharacterized protein N7509_008342 [Penicillium cosmopolitanum]KAJ5385801.1 hypothetical protein N7509_008342 [Penicillium cosmopolitanum]
MLLGGRIAVVGFIFALTEDGSGDVLVENILSQVHKIASPGMSVRVGRLRFGHLAGQLESYPIYQYSGSLTTPPCTENVAWFISSEPLALSVRHFNAIKHVLKFNSRYTQNTPSEINLLEVAAAELDPTTHEVKSVQHELR